MRWPKRVFNPSSPLKSNFDSLNKKCNHLCIKFSTIIVRMSNFVPSLPLGSNPFSFFFFGEVKGQNPITLTKDYKIQNRSMVLRKYHHSLCQLLFYFVSYNIYWISSSSIMLPIPYVNWGL